MSKPSVIIGGIIVLLSVLGGFFFLYLQQHKNVPIEYTSSETISKKLTEKSTDYAKAKEYQKNERYDLAQEYYEKSLAHAEDRHQLSQIKLDIAVMNEIRGQYRDAIKQLKELAADTGNSSLLRAYAIQEIGMMYYRYFSSEIQSETFKDTPYNSFINDGTVNMAYTRLFEYAAHFYPLGNSEAQIASGYARALTEELKGATTSPLGVAYIARIVKSLQAADADISRIETVGEGAVMIPDLLARQGSAISRLEYLGVIKNGEAETYYQRALAYSLKTNHLPGSYTSFTYAQFLLSRFGAARAEDIRSILHPFRVGNEKEVYNTIVDYFRMVRTDSRFARTKKQIIKMGNIAPDFQTYLYSLGWQSSDFK